MKTFALLLSLFVLTLTSFADGWVGGGVGTYSGTFSGNGAGLTNSFGKTLVGQYGPTTNVFSGLNLNLPHWRYALARAKAGQGEARILAIGDSTTCGFGAYAPFYNYTNCAPFAWPQQLARFFSYGSGGSFMGSKIASGTPLVSSLAVYDPRITLGSWTLSGIDTLGNQLIGSTVGNTNPFTFTPYEPCNYADFWFVGYSGNGAVNVAVDGIVVTNCNTSVGSSTTPWRVSVPFGNHTFSLWQTNASGFPAYLEGIITGNLSNGVECVNAGWDSARVSNFLETGASYSPSNIAAAFAPDLYVINLGINEQINAISLSTYSNNLQSLCSGIKTPNSDILLLVPTPIYDYGWSTNWEQTIQAIAANNGYGCLSLNQLFANNWNFVNTNGFAYDHLHLTKYGYGSVAEFVASQIAGGPLNQSPYYLTNAADYSAQTNVIFGMVTNWDNAQDTAQLNSFRSNTVTSLTVSGPGSVALTTNASGIAAAVTVNSQTNATLTQLSTGNGNILTNLNLATNSPIAGSFLLSADGTNSRWSQSITYSNMTLALTSNGVNQVTLNTNGNVTASGTVTAGNVVGSLGTSNLVGRIPYANRVPIDWYIDINTYPLSTNYICLGGPVSFGNGQGVAPRLFPSASNQDPNGYILTNLYQYFQYSTIALGSTNYVLLGLTNAGGSSASAAIVTNTLQGQPLPAGTNSGSWSFFLPTNVFLFFIESNTSGGQSRYISGQIGFTAIPQ